MTRAGALLIGVGFLASSFASGIVNDSYNGYAYVAGNKEFVYVEQFTDKILNGKHVETRTKYYNTANELIAERSLNFERSRFAPDFKTEDLRSGYIEGAEVKGQKVRLFFRSNKTSEVKEKTIEIPQPMIIDGGFNQFIKAHWKELEAGESLVFNFAVPSRLDYFSMRATKVELIKDKMTVRIEPDKRIMRWLAPAIMVQYDLNTKRITSYEGISNISDDSGHSFFIHLKYPEKGP